MEFMMEKLDKKAKEKCLKRESNQHAQPQRRARYPLRRAVVVSGLLELPHVERQKTCEKRDKISEFQSIITLPRRAFCKNGQRETISRVRIRMHTKFHPERPM